MNRASQKLKHLAASHPEVFACDEAYQLASLRFSPDMAEVIWEVKRGLARGQIPEKSEEGTSETYFLKDEEGIPIAVFKHEKYLAEYAAYRLDHRGFAQVPQTVLTTLEHPVWGGKRRGSCQLFVEGEAVVQIPRKQYRSFSAASVRRVAQLDIRLMNQDRNYANLLVDQDSLIPIDHELTLSQTLSKAHFIWVYWNQSATPFDPEEVTYISQLDPEEDRRLLIDEVGLEEKVANRHYVATVLLQRATTQGFLPDQIGRLMILGEEKITDFETLIRRLRAREAESWPFFRRIVYDEIDQLLVRQKNAFNEYTH